MAAAVTFGMALERLLGQLTRGELDDVLRQIGHRQHRLKWQRLPDQIVLLRHGESEGNANNDIYTSKGDALLELTPGGLLQASQAGARLKKLVGCNKRVFAVVSSLERTQQTLLGLYRGGFPEHMVARVQVSSQIREQEFGNFQTVGCNEAARAEQALVGRFYHRRPNAESSADVYGRVATFWDELINDLLPNQDEEYGTCLIVTHGLTMRLLMMRIFQWSVETFETVWNVGNGHYVTLYKDPERMCYVLCPERSFPAELPWATRNVWVVFKSQLASKATEDRLHALKDFKKSPHWAILQDIIAADQHRSAGAPEHAHGEGTGQWLEIDRAIDETENRRMMERSKPYTVLDYLTIPQPRTMQREALVGRLVPGHRVFSDRKEAMEEARMETKNGNLKWDDVEFVDWWGSRLSYQGKMLRSPVASVPAADSNRHEVCEGIKRSAL